MSVKKILTALFALLILNIVVVCNVDKWKHDSLTDVAIFKRIPQTFFWNFK